MANNLKEYFPLIRERAEVLSDIHKKPALLGTFNSWSTPQQEEFLDFCTGVRGVKILNDSFFKEVMNPEYAPERMNDFLSNVLRQKVTILQTLPNDSVRLASEGSLLITDLIVELENGSIVNLEVQRIGYNFPGERAACYSADMLLRQYKRVRESKGKAFTYKNIKPVYIIVLFEKSPKEFYNYPETYLHYAEAQSDTGIQINLLQKYVFIPLDIFQKTRHNKPIDNKVDAWLTFLSTEDPEAIEGLITACPEFKPMYDDIYELCRNTERVMNMFSKELQILDENTVQYMMDEMQETIDSQNGTIGKLSHSLQEKDGTIKKQNTTIEKQKQDLAEKDLLIQQLQQQLENSQS